MYLLDLRFICVTCYTKWYIKENCKDTIKVTSNRKSKDSQYNGQKGIIFQLYSNWIFTNILNFDRRINFFM